MKLLFIFALLISAGYLSGLMAEAVMEGPNSKILHLFSTGTLNSDWIPFFVNADIAKIQELKKNVGAESFDFPSFIQYGELSTTDQSPINEASVGFNIGVVPIVNNGKSSFQNVVDKCIFHSFDSFSPLCVICKISDMNGNVIGEGMVLEDFAYSPSQSIEIPLTPVPEPIDPNGKQANDVQNVNHVQVKICSPGGEGCTPGYWKQSQHFGSWTAPYTPTNPGATKYGEPDPADVFTVPGSLMIKVDNVQIVLKDATLLQALNAQGGGVNALARHSAAALLNAASPANYAFSVAEVIAMVNAALASGDATIIEDTKDKLAFQNEKGCPFGRDPGTDPDPDPKPDPDPEPNCEDCQKPDKFIVKYNGPDVNTVEISKKGKDKLTIGTFDNDQLIEVDAIALGFKGSRVQSDTTYTFSSGGEINIHTSCSQLLFVGQVFSDNGITLTVVSGTLDGVSSIPDETCPVVLNSVVTQEEAPAEEVSSEAPPKEKKK
jgi:hypothetical protein